MPQETPDPRLILSPPQTKVKGLLTMFQQGVSMDVFLISGLHEHEKKDNTFISQDSGQHHTDRILSAHALQSTGWPHRCF